MPEAQVQDDNVTLGDKNVETSQFDRYKGVKGRTDRIAVLSSTLIRGYRCYEPKKKRSFRAPTNPEVLEAVKKALGPPEQRFGLILFHYTTDESGNLLDAAKCQGKVKTWVISEARYEELSNIHRSWPLLDSDAANPTGAFSVKQQDLQVKCTEEQYQRMTFTPMPEAHWKKKEAWYKALKEKATAAMPKLKLAIGKVMTDLEIMELIGTALPSQTGGTQNAGDIDLSDVLDEVG